MKNCWTYKAGKLKDKAGKLKELKVGGIYRLRCLGPSSWGLSAGSFVVITEATEATVIGKRRLNPIFYALNLESMEEHKIDVVHNNEIDYYFEKIAE